jgi:hypothetical protein
MTGDVVQAGVAIGIGRHDDRVQRERRRTVTSCEAIDQCLDTRRGEGPVMASLAE